jgi:hypothetical protein
MAEKMCLHNFSTARRAVSRRTRELKHFVACLTRPGTDSEETSGLDDFDDLIRETRIVVCHGYLSLVIKKNEGT